MDQNFRREAHDYERIETIIRYLEQNFKQQPELKDIASHIGLSEFHFQRLFTRWVGISPKRFLQYLTKEYAKSLLRKSEDVLSASYASGLSGPGRLHDLFVHCEAVTPGEYKLMGRNLNIVYGIHPTPFGDCMLAETERGICGLFFLQGRDEEKYIKRLQNEWPNAALVRNQQKTGEAILRVFNLNKWDRQQPLTLFLKGTNFQLKVWEALLRIPGGNVVAYEDIAQVLGNAGAVRAVGSAVARNPVSYLIPCHRVIRKYGDYGNYQGGPARKKAILAWEAAVHADR